MPLIVAAFVLLFVPSLAFKHIWLDVRSVTVTPDLSTEIDRVIWIDFPGTFVVELRRARDHRFICAGQPSPRLINYKRAASRKNPINMSLLQWASLDELWEVRLCLSRGLVADEAFYLTTCHTAFGLGGVSVFGLQIARRCVQSGEFIPSAEAIDRLHKLSAVVP